MSNGPVIIAPASDESVLLGMVNRSEWHWIATEDGMLLGFFPREDAFEAAWNGQANQTRDEDWRQVNQVRE